MRESINKATVLFIIACSLTFFAGCANQQPAQFYVDAVVLQEMGRTQQAVEKLNTAIEINPRFSPAHSLLGDIYQQIKKYQKSAEAYEKATKLNQLSFRDYFNLGKVCQIMREFTRAVKAYLRACQLKPDHYESHLNTAKCYFELKEYDSALDYGQAAKAIDPNASDVEEMLGDIYEAKKDYDQAIASYRHALEMQGNKPQIMVSLAVAYLKSKRFMPAKELLEQVIEAQPGNGTAYQYLGYCHLRLKEQSETAAEKMSRVEKGIESYRKAVQINDNDWMAHKGLGVAYMIKALGEKNAELKATAIEHWQRSLEIKPDQANSKKLRRLIKSYSK